MTDMPPTKRRCRSCERVTLSRQAWAPLDQGGNGRVVSPTGIMHIRRPERISVSTPVTLCGQWAYLTRGWWAE